MSYQRPALKVQGPLSFKPLDRTEERMPDAALISLLEQAKLVSRQYRELTGRPLGCTGEIGERGYPHSRSRAITGAAGRLRCGLAHSCG